MVSKNSRAPVMADGGSGAAEALLLPEHVVGDAEAPPGGASVLGAVFNVSTSVVGAGIMSIPAAMRVLGVAPAVALIVGVALLANAAVDFMLRYTRAPPSYAALMGGSFGRAGAALLNVFVAFNCIGTLTVYLIIIGDVMSGPTGGGKAHAGVLPESFGPHWWTGREAVLVAAAVILLPLVFRKRVDSLRFTSAVSILLAAVFMLISMGIAVYALFSGTAEMPRMLPDFSRLSSPLELFTAVPVIVVAFTFHFNVLARMSWLAQRSSSHPRGAEQDVGHEGGRARLPRAVLRHLRGGRLLRLPPLRRRDHARRARQLRPQLRIRRPTGAQRRRAPQLRAAPRARFPAPPLLAPGQRRRAPLPGPAAAGHGHSPVRVAHGRAHGGALRSRHRHPQHLDSLRVLRVDVRGLHLVDLPWRHCSQGCLRNSKEEGQGIGGNDDHSGSDHEQHRHCLQHHELHQGMIVS